MPNCIQLRPIGEKEPVTFHLIDEQLCKAFDTPLSNDRWFRDWYAWLAFGLALGFTFDKLRTIYPEPEAIEVIDWIETHYTPSAWVEIGRR